MSCWAGQGREPGEGWASERCSGSWSLTFFERSAWPLWTAVTSESWSTASWWSLSCSYDWRAHQRKPQKRKDSEVLSPGGALVIGISAECFHVKARPWIDQREDDTAQPIDKFPVAEPFLLCFAASGYVQYIQRPSPTLSAKLPHSKLKSRKRESPYNCL